MVDITSLNSALSQATGNNSTGKDKADNTNFLVPSALSVTEKGGTLSDATNAIFSNTAVGSITDAIGSSIYGINHRQTPGAIQLNKDLFGLTFFTRPTLNLTWDNVKNIRKLAPLLTTDPTSIQRIIRCLLDRDLCKGDITTGAIVSSPLVDEQQAFIPMLTNHILSMSGWPDVNAPTMTSQSGAYQEAFSMIDGVTDIYSTYDIQANFRNIPGDPITLLFLVWLHYASAVYQGTMLPYFNKIIENEIDYNTRIYRLVLDSSKRYVKKIAACGAAFPISAPIGAAFNYEHERPINSSNDQISIPLRCIGAIYQDDILISEFNKTTELFNIGLKDANRDAQYMKIPIDALGLFNNQGYPRINQDTYELEWYVSLETYAQMYGSI